MPVSYLLAIDQGTTSTRALVLTAAGQVVASSQQALPQSFPHAGWVEHDPERIWQDTVQVCRNALKEASVSAQTVAALGITNQRETTVLWRRDTGAVIHSAIVWQDRRTAEFCAHLKAQGLESSIQAKTGLLLDPYFSASKIRWILELVPNARTLAAQGLLAFGTIDTFLVWRLTGGKVHATDATNASRTLLFNIHTQMWDDELLALFEIPRSLLPDVKDSSADYGLTEPELFGAPIRIAAVAGDQHAAMVGQACFQPGMVKSTYGTGAFMMLNTGAMPVSSQHRLLTAVAYRLNGEVTYALEGSVFIAGAVVQWLRDKLKVIQDSRETEALANSVPDTLGVYFVPALTGLGAPYWDPTATGLITGLTRNTEIAHIVRAALEAIAYSTRDLFAAMTADAGLTIHTLRVDGGMVANHWLCQFLADMVQVTVERPAVIETTALGVAYLAGLQVGLFGSLAEIAERWQCQQRFAVQMGVEQQAQLYQGWQRAVQKAVTP